MLDRKTTGKGYLNMAGVRIVSTQFPVETHFQKRRFGFPEASIRFLPDLYFLHRIDVGYDVQ